MKRITVAQIGANKYSHSRYILNSLKKQRDLFDLVGCVLPENERERLPERMEEMSGLPELTLDRVLSDPAIEAVTIETDEIYLTKYALMAAKAGKHIHMEKPGGTDLAGFEQLIAEMKKSGKVFSTGYMYRHNPFVADALRKVKSGELGTILSVEAQMSCRHPKEMRQWLAALPGGMMFYLGCHLVDLILQIQGRPERIIPLNRCSGVSGVTGEDFGMAVFEYPSGVSFAKTTAVEIGGFERRQLVICGTKGTIELKPFEWYLPDFSGMQTFRTSYTRPDWHVSAEKDVSPVIDRYDGMMAAFAAYIRGEAQNPYTLDYELELYRTVLRACGAYAGD